MRTCHLFVAASLALAVAGRAQVPPPPPQVPQDEGVPPPIERTVPLRELKGVAVYTDALRLPPDPGKQVGRVDAAKTIQVLRFAGVEAYNFLVWQGPDDLEDLKLLLHEAQRVEMQVWVSFVPPSMGGNSLPHLGAFEKWAEEFASLAKRFPSLVAVHIPQVDQGKNMTYLNQYRLWEMRKTLNAAGLWLFAGMYDITPEWVHRFQNSFDGVVLCVTSFFVLGVDGLLCGTRKQLPAGWKLFPGYYCAPTSWQREPPDTTFLHYALRRAFAREQCVMLFNLDLGNPARVLPGKDGWSNLIRVLRDYLTAVKSGQAPQRPDY